MVTSEEYADYSYNLTAGDNENDELFFSLDLAPTGMTVDEQSGVISWRPDHTQAGEHAVTARVTDSHGAFGLQHYTITITDTMVEVPDLVGEPQVEVEQMLAEAVLIMGEVSEEYSDTVPETRIMSHEPAAGEIVPIGSAVNMTISLGPPVYAVPDVIGMPQMPRP